MTAIYEWPREWYRFTTQRFVLRARSQVSSRPWIGGNSVYGPHAQIWMPSMSGIVTEPFLWQNVSAFFSRLEGQAGLLRIGHSIRLRPQFNRQNIGSQQGWSDGSVFSDGSQFVSGKLPPTAFVLSAASRGDKYIVIGGLLADTPRALRRGDLLEFRPSGIADAVPRLHEVMIDNPTNAAGETGVEIRPALRSSLAAGDMVVLENPMSVFHLIDDSQGELETSLPSRGNFGFSLVEAIENA